MRGGWIPEFGKTSSEAEYRSQITQNDGLLLHYPLAIIGLLHTCISVHTSGFLGGKSCALVWGTQKFQNKYKSLVHACYFPRNATRNQDASLLLCLVFQNAHGTWGKRNEFSCFMLGSQHKNLHHLSSFCAPSTEKQWHLDFRFCICQTNSLWHYPLYSNWMMNLAHH